MCPICLHNPCLPDCPESSAADEDERRLLTWEMDVHELDSILERLANWCPCGADACEHTIAARAALAVLRPIESLFVGAQPGDDLPAALPVAADLPY
jgi:hypothetical protein